MPACVVVEGSVALILIFAWKCQTSGSKLDDKARKKAQAAFKVRSDARGALNRRLYLL